MSNQIFSPKNQEKDVGKKIVVGLERISEAFKVLLWQKAKQSGLSPIQIQLLIFISNHTADLCNVSYLAKEFNITKPTVSEALKSLEKKELILKDFSSADKRAHAILLTLKGKEVVLENQNFAQPLYHEIEKLELQEIETFYYSLSKVIYTLNQLGVLNVQRTCFGCRYYSEKEEGHFCGFLNVPILNKDILLDCPEFEEK